MDATGQAGLGKEKEKEKREEERDRDAHEIWLLLLAPGVCRLSWSRAPEPAALPALLHALWGQGTPLLSPPSWDASCCSNWPNPRFLHLIISFSALGEVDAGCARSVSQPAR